ncbi:sensor histidine kinase [Frankia sp. Cr1]|uniref:sensor histidine kinase n=1 Tax=Frankia sp. Cr1 TaxID=3073931 RepID=UPI002AD460E9|nr:ATP-binding protein [Frankia sp. Cr1]
MVARVPRPEQPRAGPAERQLVHLALRFGSFCRVVVTVGCGALGLVVVPHGRLTPAVACVVVVAGWTCVYAAAMVRGRRRWPVAADVVILGLAGLAQSWTVPRQAMFDGSSWLLAVVSMAAVTYQWQVPPVAGAAATFPLVAGYAVGAGMASGGQGLGWLPIALWILAEAALSRGFFLLVRHGGRVSDRTLARREQARWASALSRARRDDEREQLAALHDTAAATLLMVGTGAVPAWQPWLAVRANRDLEVLGLSAAATTTGEVDLADLLADVATEVSEMSTVTGPAGRLTVRHPSLPSLKLPPGPAGAIRDSVREALCNVVRHARTSEATLSVVRDDGLIVVEVRDAGRGFIADRVPAHRWGVTESITARMARIGGRARVDSSPGAGTVVRLEWSDD